MLCLQADLLSNSTDVLCTAISKAALALNCIVAPQAHFRKVTVHMVGKSGSVLHTRRPEVELFGEL